MISGRVRLDFKQINEGIELDLSVISTDPNVAVVQCSCPRGTCAASPYCPANSTMVAVACSRRRHCCGANGSRSASSAGPLTGASLMVSQLIARLISRKADDGVGQGASKLRILRARPFNRWRDRSSRT